MLAYTFARIGAVVSLKVEDYFRETVFCSALTKKAAKRKSFPCTTSWKTSWTNASKRPASAPSQILLRSLLTWAEQAKYRAGPTSGQTPRTMLKRRLKQGGLRPTIRLTHSGRPASPIFWRMTRPSKPLSESPVTRIAGPRNSMTAGARRYYGGYGPDSVLTPS
jgi:hypothetical protein